MKDRILCYGDSNTYGYQPENGERYSEKIRWTGILSNRLGKRYVVIEEGLNNRTTALEPEGEPWRSGLLYLEPCLRSHIPVDVFILMLGSNDMKIVFHQTPESIGNHLRLLIREIRRISKEKNPQGRECKILLISPIRISEKLLQKDETGEFGGMWAIELSRKLSPVYEKIAKEEQCYYLDGATVTEPSQVDGLHLSPEGHRKMAEAIEEKILEICEKSKGK